MKPLFTVVFCFLFFFGKSQMIPAEFRALTYENKKFALTNVEVFPDKIKLTVNYTAAFNGDKFILWRTVKLTDSRLWDEKLISEVEGINFDEWVSLKEGRSKKFTMTFPANIATKIKKAVNSQSKNLGGWQNSLSFNFLVCSDKIRKDNNIAYGSCFDIYSILVHLTPEQWKGLYLSSFLQEYAQKGEFETTVQYNQRMKPDSLQPAVRKEFNKLLQFFEKEHKVLFFGKRTPKAEYNADLEQFTLIYPGYEPVVIKVPLSIAPKMKEELLSYKLKLVDANTHNLPNGKFHFSTITLSSDGVEKKTYQNELKLNADVSNQIYKQTLTDLGSIYPVPNGL